MKESVYPQLPVCCNPRAYATMVHARKTLSSSDSLLEGAVAVAQHFTPEVNFYSVDQTIQRFVDTLRRRFRSKVQQAKLAHLHQYFFEELRFVFPEGALYDDLGNGSISSVIKTRHGLPTVVGLIYKLIAERLGLAVYGVSLHDAFLVGVRSSEVPCQKDVPLLIDPSNEGRQLTKLEVKEYLEGTIEDDDFEWSDDLLRPVSHKRWLTRLTHTLIHNAARLKRLTDLAAMLELQMALWPEMVALEKDVALVWANVGKRREAIALLVSYLKKNPKDSQGKDIAELIEILRGE
jgi:regulator of sirC expression with transglutaminase-like and TPR domain